MGGPGPGKGAGGRNGQAGRGPGALTQQGQTRGLRGAGLDPRPAPPKGREGRHACPCRVSAACPRVGVFAGASVSGIPGISMPNPVSVCPCLCLLSLHVCVRADACGILCLCEVLCRPAWVSMRVSTCLRVSEYPLPLGCSGSEESRAEAGPGPPRRSGQDLGVWTEGSSGEGTWAAPVSGGRRAGPG